MASATNSRWLCLRRYPTHDLTGSSYASKAKASCKTEWNYAILESHSSIHSQSKDTGSSTQAHIIMTMITAGKPSDKLPLELKQIYLQAQFRNHEKGQQTFAHNTRASQTYYQARIKRSK